MTILSNHLAKGLTRHDQRYFLRHFSRFLNVFDRRLRIEVNNLWRAIFCCFSPNLLSLVNLKSKFSNFKGTKQKIKEKLKKK